MKKAYRQRDSTLFAFTSCGPQDQFFDPQPARKSRTSSPGWKTVRMGFAVLAILLLTSSNSFFIQPTAETSIHHRAQSKTGSNIGQTVGVRDGIGVQFIEQHREGNAKLLLKCGGFARGVLRMPTSFTPFCP